MAAATALGTGLAVTLAACATATPAFTPKPVVTITPSAPPKPTPSATQPASASATPSASSTPSSAGVKATGSLKLYLEVTRALTGSCRTVDGTPTLTLADKKNDFYGTVDISVQLDAARKQVARVDGAFGEDSEGNTWKLSYRQGGKAITLRTAGQTYTMKGRITARDSGSDADQQLPFTLVVTCAGSGW